MAPHEVYLRFGEKQLGMIGNDGSLNTNYTQSIADRQMAPSTGAFRGGAISGS